MFERHVVHQIVEGQAADVCVVEEQGHPSRPTKTSESNNE